MARQRGSRTGRCRGCNHLERVRIERLLAAGASIQEAARKFAIDYHALRRHWRNHVSAEARAAYIAGAGATKDQLEEFVADEARCTFRTAPIRCCTCGNKSIAFEAASVGVVLVAFSIHEARDAAAQQAKWSSGTEPPKLKAPANACDCHHHIYGSQYMVDPRSTLRPGDATVEDYRQFQKRIGTSRNVVVQPSTYGTENAPTLDAVAAFGPTARAVV